MADCFHDIDEVRDMPRSEGYQRLLTSQRSGKPSSRPMFAKDRVDRTLAHGYFEMLGTLTKHREGMLSVGPIHC
jgi:hypothetical protein